MAVRIDDPRRRDPDVVRAVLAGDSSAISVPAAVSAVLELDVPIEERADLVRRVLSSAEDPVARVVAAAALRRVGTDAATEQLRAALADEPVERVAGDIALALGYVGEERDVLALESKAAQATGGFTANRSRFAAGLIAHRFGLAAPGVHFPPAELRLALGERTLPVRARKPRDDEVAKALEGIGNEPVGFATGPDLVHALECGPKNLYVALNREIAADFDALLERKAVLGAIETYSEEHERATPAHLLLTAPSDNGFELLITRTTGEELYRGEGRVDGGRVEAHVWSVETTAVAAVDLRLKLEGKALSAKGESDQTIRKQREPGRLK